MVCVSCTTGPEKIETMSETLPVALSTSLLYEESGERQGAQDACFFPYKKLLYGTEQSFEEIVEFYETSLSREGWAKRTDGLIQNNSPSWVKNEEYWVSVKSDPGLDFPQNVVEDAQAKYETVYFVTITHIDWIARKWCLQ